MPVFTFKKVVFAASAALLSVASAHAQELNPTDVLVQVGKGDQRLRAAAMTGRVTGARFANLRSDSATGWARMELPAGQKATPELLAQLSKTLGVKVVGNYRRHTQAVPNDPKYSSQWGLTQISAPRAWNVTTGVKQGVVAVIDSGVNDTHPDLAGNMWINSGESGNGKETNGKDDDGDGYIDDVHGVSNVNGVASGDSSDTFGHGTHVAGVIGAVGNNGVGVTGVNWATKIMSVRFMDSGGVGTDADAIAGIDYILAMKKRGVNIKAVNCSWGGPDNNPALEDAIDALDAAGILVVCSAGNGDTDASNGSNVGDNTDVTPDYPSSFTAGGIISVAASDVSDARAPFSNYGPTAVDLAAPGVGILSTNIPSGYSSLDGTSMAAPFVTGAVALIYALNPNANPAKVKQRILSSVDKLPQWSSLCVSGGRLNLNRAIRNAIYSISGQVYRINNNQVTIPLAGARVFLNGTLATNTDDNGDYSIPYLSPGNYTITVKRPGFTFTSKFAALPQDDTHAGAPNAVRNFEGTATASTYYTITGTAYDENSQPASGIEIYLNALTVPVAVTDSSGNYIIKQRPAETFTLTAKGGGLEWTASPISQRLPTVGLTTSPNGLVNFTGKVPDSTPPTVTITTPADGSTVTTSSSTAKGTATDPSGVESVFASLYRTTNGTTEFYDWSNKVWTTDSTATGVILTLNAGEVTTYNWKITLPVLSNDTYNLLMWGRDSKGNESTGSYDVLSTFTVSAAS
jgi:subtilisin family serine protease